MSVHPAIAAMSPDGHGGMRVVGETMEFRRIYSLPRRTTVHLQERLMDEALRLPHSKMRLLPQQVWALQEAMVCRGLVASLEVGSGKTGIACLLPTVTRAERPLLLVPGELQKKTLRHSIPLWRENFRVHENLRVMTYEKLSRDKQADFFDAYKPDCIVADEAHRLKSTTNAGHRRLARYFQSNPGARFYALSGTLDARVRDCALLFFWALRDRSPLPHGWKDIQDWADVLDVKGPPEELRPMPGALLHFREGDENVRDALRRRKRETEGYVFTFAPTISTALRVTQVDIPQPPEVVEAMEILREWHTPDGDDVVDALEMSRHAREMAQYGLFYRWKWPADFPEETKQKWIKARKYYRSFARGIIRDVNVKGAFFDTEKQVEDACRSGFLNTTVYVEAEGKYLDVFADWMAIKDQADPETEAVWLSEHMLDYVEEWLKKPRSIAWVDNTAFLEKMRERGVPCFGGGDDRILTATESCVASLPAHGEGKDLQYYNRNLFIAIPGSDKDWEQGLGRTHRQGQEADEVVAEVVLSCLEVWKMFDGACAESRDSKHKLGYADLSYENEDEVRLRPGPHWSRPKRRDE